MMKIIGIAMISISIILIGYMYYINVKLRPQELETFINLLSTYENELKWNQRSIKEILQKFNSKKCENYINEALRLIEEIDYYHAFIKSNQFYEKLHLSNEDKKTLDSFFVQTGNCGLETELQLCRNTIEELKKLKTEADTKLNKFGPLSLKLSIACGIWVAILLF